MNFKKQLLLLTLFLIIILQTLLYVNNNQRTSLRYFKWTIQEISIGKLITISFFSGLFINTLLTSTINNYKKNDLENIEENYEPINDGNNEATKTNIEMPPQRDIRDAQPTISVNYRVVKNMEEKNMTNDQNYSNNTNKEDDWNKDDNEW